LKKILHLLLLVLFASLDAISQVGTVKGKVSDGTAAVPFATIGIKHTKLVAVSDAEGSFVITHVPAGEQELQVSVIGFEKYTQKITVENGNVQDIAVVLKASTLSLEQVVVTGTMKETFISASPVKIEVITQKFLQTNPTNNIIEAVQTVNGVQEQINCGVCGTNDIHINGMEGPYTLVLIDGMPIMSALATVYGFNGIPTSLIDRVEIIKGPSSTLYGSEAVGGVINIITTKPEKMPIIGFNTYYTSHRELNVDFAVSPKIGNKVTTTLSGNYYRNQYRMDFNEDNFTDIPLNNRFTLFNKWSIARKEHRIANIALRYYTENRFGGVMQWQPEHRGSHTVYGESIFTNRMEVIGSYQLPVSNHHLRIDYSYNFHDQDSYYGKTYYRAQQQIFFSNLLWNRKFGKHDVLTGLTLRYQLYNDNSFANTSDRKFIPGLFVQDEYSIGKTSVLLAGVRVDHHENHGFIFSPRLSFKQKIRTYTTVRLNSGTGFRLVHLFTEDHAALTGARQVVIKNNLEPEQSYNVNLNVNHVCSFANGTGTLDFDMFYTYFTNKIVPDYTIDPDLIVYDNLGGYGVTRGFAASINHAFAFPLRINVGGTFQDVYQVTENTAGEEIKEQQLFTPAFSGTFVVGYKFRKLKLSIDYTGRVMGPQKLPHYEAPFTRPETSPWFTIQNVQVTKEIKAFSVYAGIKNIFNWTQSSPLIDAANPFGKDFDTAYAWGPLQTRRFFVGVRWNLQRK
jgi:outer membrane receptor for ferrienterochelin and colicins